MRARSLAILLALSLLAAAPATAHAFCGFYVDGAGDRVDQLAAPRLVEYWEQDPSGEGAARSSRLLTLGALALGWRRRH